MNFRKKWEPPSNCKLGRHSDKWLRVDIRYKKIRFARQLYLLRKCKPKGASFGENIWIWDQGGQKKRQREYPGK